MLDLVPNYEALPQRPPKAKRKRREENTARSDADEETHKEPGTDSGAGGGAEEHTATAGGFEKSDAKRVAGSNGNTNNILGDVPISGADPETQEEYRAAAVEGQKFEYLDHTADVQLHSWGSTLQEAFENVGLCMFNYMTPLDGLSSKETRPYSAEGHDLSSLLYHWLDELLFGFSTDFFVPRELKITKFDRELWKIEAEGSGEMFDRQRHVCGTEIKAITYSAMQINETEGDAEVFAIVDI